MVGRKKKSNAGRKPKMTPELYRKIEEAAALDATMHEIAFYAGIHPATLFDWCSKDKKLSDRIKELREKPVLLARQSVVKGMQTDANLALKYLERKRKKEFGQELIAANFSGNVEINFSGLYDETKDKPDADTEDVPVRSE